MEKVNITINGIKVNVPSDYTVMMAAAEAGIDIPRLCYLKEINEIAACRICVVEVDINGRPMRNLPASCILKVEDGMEVRTNTPQVREAVKTNLELILANHNRECLTCYRNENCELQALCNEFGVNSIEYTGDSRERTYDNFSSAVIRDSGKCILCGRCVSMCKNTLGLGVLDFTSRGFETEVAPAFHYSMPESSCIECGACIDACPVAALKEKSYVEGIWKDLENSEKYVVLQIYPDAEESLCQKINTDNSGNMVSLLKKLNFEKVFSPDESIAVCSILQAEELAERIKKNEKLPMIITRSSDAVKYCQLYHDQLVDNLSSSGMPHEIFGVMSKEYISKANNIDKENIVTVVLSDSISKKSDIDSTDINYVITSQEMINIIRRSGILLSTSGEEGYDSIGIASYKSNVSSMLSLEKIVKSFSGSSIEMKKSGISGILQGEAEIKIQDALYSIKAAAADSISAGGELLSRLKNDLTDLHLIEITGYKESTIVPDIDCSSFMKNIPVDLKKKKYGKITSYPIENQGDFEELIVK